MHTVRARNLRVGMRISLDMGRGTPMDEIVTIVAMETAESLFCLPLVRLTVKRYSGEESITEFYPDNIVSLEV